jgi:hypothetical protein
VDAFGDGFGDPQCAISAPAETAAGWLDDEDASLVLKQAAYRVRAQAPPLRDLGNREVLLKWGWSRHGIGKSGLDR